MKDIVTLEQYAIELCDDGIYNHYGMYTTDNKDAIFPLKVSDTEILLIPAPEFSRFLYRGQNEYFDICKPMILRPMKYEVKLISILKKLEFINALKVHPLSKLFKEKYFLEKYPQFPNYKLKIDYEAIAQHYEFKTNHLDFTRDKDIAMFFMTCKYDPKTKKYTSITDNSSGVLYSYDLKLGIMDNKHIINPIGFQPFSRPDKQKAFSIVFKKNVNFNKFNFAIKENIVLTKELSEKYFEMFDEGKILFPKDEVSELAYEIQGSEYISKDTIEYYSTISKIPKLKINKILKKNNIIVTENKYGFNICNRNLHIQNIMKIMQDLDNRIHPRGTCGHIEIP